MKGQVSGAPIDAFVGEYRFLSNFYEAPLTWRGKMWRSAEHAYQASKAVLDADAENIRQMSTPGRAKRAGRKILLRSDWEEIRLQVMEEVVAAKFSAPALAAMLKNTAPAELIEGNSHNDHFWGVCRGRGENHLGKILMRVRSRLLEEDKTA